MQQRIRRTRRAHDELRCPRRAHLLGPASRANGAGRGEYRCAGTRTEPRPSGSQVGCPPPYRPCRSSSTSSAAARTARATSLLHARGIEHTVVSGDGVAGFRAQLRELTGGVTVPQVVVDGRPSAGPTTSSAWTAAACCRPSPIDARCHRQRPRHDADLAAVRSELPHPARRLEPRPPRRPRSERRLTPSKGEHP